jgi:hypothetical protein
MFRRSLALTPVVAALILAAPAVAAEAQSVTATGSAEVKVKPADRHSSASIAAAVVAAEKQAVPKALIAAHAQALLYAQDTGLTLGSLLSVSDAQSGQFFGGGPGVEGNIGPFGPGNYCGTVRRPIVRKVNGKRKVIGTKKVHMCFVPGFAGSTLTVTYAAT